MSSNKKIPGLSKRDQELTAIGSAIASNCIPCIEYHIPQGRKTGLSDSQIREAVELADKVRRVPADKGLQTAYALLGDENQIDNQGSKENNDMKEDNCCSNVSECVKACDTDEVDAGSAEASVQSGFDFSKMLEMIQGCCPDKMKDFSSMAPNVERGCCPSNEHDCSKQSA